MFNLDRALQLSKFKILSPWLPILCILLGCATAPEKDVLRKIPRSERSDLVVLNFRNNTTEDRANMYQPWELGLASMMMTDLERIGLFNIISSKDIRALSRDMGIDYPKIEAEEDTLKVGRIVSSRYALSGSFMEMDGVLRIEARVFSVENEMQLGAASVTGRTDNFFELQKQLVLQVTQYLKAVLNEQEVSAIIGNIETTSVSASLNNYAGEIAVLRADEYRERGQTEIAATYEEEAKEKFKTALAYDPKYERASSNLAKLVKGMPITL